MDFALSPTSTTLQETLLGFMDEHVYPAEAVYEEQIRRGG